MLINKWHKYLNMPKHDLGWHEKDLNEEMDELKEAKGFVNIWSEMSDVVYAYTRAKYSGHLKLKLPLSRVQFIFGLVYMLPKYTIRWKFFRKIGKSFDKNLNINEVSNPKKIYKLEDIANKHNLDKEVFKKRSEKLLKRWILLK